MALKSTEVLSGTFRASRRYHSYHNGVDFACPTGTNVKARYAGIITTTGSNPPGKDFGNYIRMRYAGSKVDGWYAHIIKFLVKKGQKVKKGQFIAKSGNTGLSTGPHLHYSESTGNINWLNPDKTNVKEVEDMYGGKNAEYWFRHYRLYVDKTKALKKTVALQGSAIKQLQSDISVLNKQIDKMVSIAEYTEKVGLIATCSDRIQQINEKLTLPYTASQKMRLGAIHRLLGRKKVTTDEEEWSFVIVWRFIKDLFKGKVK